MRFHPKDIAWGTVNRMLFLVNGHPAYFKFLVCYSNFVLLKLIYFKLKRYFLEVCFLKTLI